MFAPKNQSKNQSTTHNSIQFMIQQKITEHIRTFPFFDIFDGEKPLNPHRGPHRGSINRSAPRLDHTAAKHLVAGIHAKHRVGATRAQLSGGDFLLEMAHDWRMIVI